MKLYVCYDFLKTVQRIGRPGGHPCGNAHNALREAGHEFEVEAVHGLGLAPFNRTPGRRKIEEMTGQSWVPVLETDSGELIPGSHEIIAWAETNAPAAPAPA